MKNMGLFLEHSIFTNLKVFEIQNFEMLDQIRKRQAPSNNDNSLHKILKTLDMGSIAIKNMTCYFGKLLKSRNQETITP